jgi:hypothetical protein
MTGLFKKGYKLLVLFALILFQSCFVSAQTLKINARFDSTSILIGDQVKLHLEVDQPKNAKVKFPVFTDTITGKIKVVKTFPADTSKNGDNLHIRKDFLITSFDSGYNYIAPLAFPFEIGQIKDTIRSTSLFLLVFTMPNDTAKDIRDIKPPYKAPFTIAEIWLFIVIGAGVLLLAFAIWYFVKKYRKEPIFGYKKPTEPPHVIALRDLDNLRGEKLWQQNKVKQYYTRLSEIIRVYIEQRYEINALEMISDEIIDALKNQMIDDINSIDLLRSMFATADLVKFAKLQPLPNENEICLLNAYQFVNNTKQVLSVMDPDNNKESDEVMKVKS